MTNKRFTENGQPWSGAENSMQDQSLTAFEVQIVETRRQLEKNLERANDLVKAKEKELDRSVAREQRAKILLKNALTTNAKLEALQAQSDCLISELVARSLKNDSDLKMALKVLLYADDELQELPEQLTNRAEGLLAHMNRMMSVETSIEKLRQPSQRVADITVTVKEESENHRLITSNFTEEDRELAEKEDDEDELITVDDLNTAEDSPSQKKPQVEILKKTCQINLEKVDDNKSEVERHMQLVSKPIKIHWRHRLSTASPEKCPVFDCEAKFRCANQIITHIMSKHGGQISCPHEGCGNPLAARYVIRHIEKFHGKKYFGQSHVSSVMKPRKKVSSRSRKIRRVQGVPSKCLVADCDAYVQNESQMRKHIEEKHGGQISCPKSNCTSVLKANSIYTHLKMCHRKCSAKSRTGLDFANRVGCDYCQKKFWKKNLAVHVRYCAKNPERWRAVEDNAFSKSSMNVDSHVSPVINETQIKCNNEDTDVVLPPEQNLNHDKEVHEQDLMDNPDKPEDKPQVAELVV